MTASRTRSSLSVSRSAPISRYCWSSSTDLGKIAAAGRAASSGDDAPCLVEFDGEAVEEQPAGGRQTNPAGHPLGPAAADPRLGHCFLLRAPPLARQPCPRPEREPRPLQLARRAFHALPRLHG